MNEPTKRDGRLGILDSIERVLKILREIGLLLVLGGVLVFLGPEAPRLAKELQTASVSEVDLGLVKLKVAQAENALQDALQLSAAQSGPEDTKAPEQTQLIASALRSIQDASSSVVSSSWHGASPAQSFWVYLGSRRDQTWQTTSFGLQDVPTPDSVVRPTVDVFGRRRAPMLLDGQWTKGDVVGVLEAGHAAKVIRTQRVPGKNSMDLWWAEVTPQ